MLLASSRRLTGGVSSTYWSAGSLPPRTAQSGLPRTWTPLFGGQRRTLKQRHWSSMTSNARVLVEGRSDEEARALPVQIDALTLSKMEISAWRTGAGDLDILVEIPARGRCGSGRRPALPGVGGNAAHRCTTAHDVAETEHEPPTTSSNR
jgi:hypothetical protein